MSKGVFDSASLDPLTMAILAVVTEELARFSSPTADERIAFLLAKELGDFVSGQFIDPANPFSVTNGVSALSSDGDPAADFAALLAAYAAGGGRTETVVVIMSSDNCVGAALSGNRVFENLTPQGGTAAGVTVIGSNAADDHVVAIDAARLLVADDGIRLSPSRQASIEMLDNPTNSTGVSDSPPVAVATSMVSLFQTNSLGLLAERIVNWEALSGSVALLSGADYLGAVGSPSS